METNQLTDSESPWLEFVDVGAGSGGLTSAVCRQIHNAGFKLKYRLWFVDLETADPACFFGDRKLRCVVDSLLFLGDDYRSWLSGEKPLPTADCLRIALISRLFNNLSRFSSQHISGSGSSPLVEKMAISSDSGVHLPHHCLAPGGKGTEALVVSNTRLALANGRTFAQASLSDYYRGMYIISRQESTADIPEGGLFQPVSEVLELGYRVLEFLFSQEIGMAFLSKGKIPEKTMKLLLDNADKVRAQIGVITLNGYIQRTFEPNTASPGVRIEQMAKLIAGGIATEARLDPVLPGLTDNEDALRQFFLALAKAGVKRVAVSTLFLRSSVLQSVKRNVGNTELLQRLLAFYQEAKRMAIHAERSSVIALPIAVRKEIYTHIGHIAGEHDIKLSICACKNPDLAHGTCNIGGNWPRQETQRNLFE